MTITSFTFEILQPCGEFRKISHINSNVAGKFTAQIPVSVYHQTTRRNEVCKNEEWPPCICLVRKWRTNGLNLTATHNPLGSWKIAQCFWNIYKCRETKTLPTWPQIMTTLLMWPVLLLVWHDSSAGKIIYERFSFTAEDHQGGSKF